MSFSHLERTMKFPIKCPVCTTNTAKSAIELKQERKVNCKNCNAEVLITDMMLDNIDQTLKNMSSFAFKPYIEGEESMREYAE